MTDYKRPLVLALASVLAVPAAFGSTVLTAPASVATDSGCPSPAVQPTTGDGTVGDPWLIATPANLQWIKETSSAWNDSWTQIADINMTGCVWDNPIGGTGAFLPSGFTVDGANYAITGLTVVAVESSGLYARASDAIFRNLNLSITVNSNSTNFPAGGIVGQLQSSSLPGTSLIENSSVSGSITGGSRVGGVVGSLVKGTISESRSTASVTATNVDEGIAGGLAGDAQESSIERSYALGGVSAKGEGAVGGVPEALGGFVGELRNSTVVDSFARGAVNYTGNGTVAPSVGGFAGEIVEAGFTTNVTRSYATGAVTANSAPDKTYVQGFIGRIYNAATASSSFWNTETSGQSTSAGGVGVEGKTTTELQQLITYTDVTAGFDWNTANPQTIAEGFNVNYTWGICSAVNGGYPFLTSFYASDPCSGGGADTTSASAPPQFTFTFLASGGGRCLDDVTVTRGQMFALPPSSAACTPTGTSLVGWSIPGQSWAFSPRREVLVIEDQVFTAVAREPEIEVTFDANVNMNDECVSDGANIDLVDARSDVVDVPREGAQAQLATSAACTPPGFALIGWTDANTPDGSGQAQLGAATYVPGAHIPGAWNIPGPNPTNQIRLYALWGRP